MSFVMMQARRKLSDTEYRVDFPPNSLVVAPPEFFKKFGTSFIEPNRSQILKDLAENALYHAVPADAKRKARSPFVVRQIHSSKVRDALAGKLVNDILNARNPVDHILPELPKQETPQESVNVYQCTNAQLVDIAKSLKIKKAEELTRKALIKSILSAQAEAGKGKETEI